MFARNLPSPNLLFLRTKSYKLSDKLNAGFIADVSEPATGQLAQAKQAGTAAKDEGSTLVITAQDHPVATDTTPALIATVAFGFGYVLGESSIQRRRPRRPPVSRTEAECAVAFRVQVCGDLAGLRLGDLRHRCVRTPHRRLAINLNRPCNFVIDAL